MADKLQRGWADNKAKEPAVAQGSYSEGFKRWFAEWQQALETAIKEAEELRLP